MDEIPTPGTTADEWSGKRPDVERAPNDEGKANSVSESAMSSVPVGDTDSRAGLFDNMVPARLIRDVKPIYPPTALKAQIQGTVVLQLIVDENGLVRDVRFISGPPILARATADAVEHWRYQPAHLNGQPLEWEKLVTMKFSLR